MKASLPTLVVGVTLVALAGCGYTSPTPLPFDSQAWKECNIRTSDARFRMAPTLLRDYKMIGWEVKQIEGLLGDSALLETEGDRVCYHYPLGEPHDEWGSWGYPYLTVEFRDGKVSRVYHLAGMGAVADHALRQP